MTSESVHNVLALILALGNYMNGGISSYRIVTYISIFLYFFTMIYCISFFLIGTSRGQADGFSLEILANLRDVKSKVKTSVDK